MLAINQEIVQKCEQMIKDYGSEIAKCENEIKNLIENKGKIEELSQKIENLKQILREVKYSYDLLVSEFELHNEGRFLNGVPSDTSVRSFVMNVEIAPMDAMIIEAIELYFANNTKYSSIECVLLDKDELHVIQNLSPQGKLKQNWRRSHNELKRLFADLEKLKKFPDVIRYFDSH